MVVDGPTPWPEPMRTPCVDPLAHLRKPGDPGYDVFLTGTVFMDIIFTGLEKAPVKGSESWAEGMGSSPGGIANLATALSRLPLPIVLRKPDFFGSNVLR